MHRPEKTLHDACESWIKTCERNGLERSTLKAYNSHKNIHIEPKIGHLLVRDLSRGEVRSFMDDLLDADISRALVKKIMVSLRAILSEAVEREWTEQNVATNVKVKRSSRRDAKQIIIPTKDEIRTILNSAPASHAAMFTNAVFTGMRISELRGLVWNAVDFDRQIIRVYQRADEYCVMWLPKSKAGTRDIPMAPTVLTTLREWKMKVPANDLGLVFPNSVGKIQNYSNIYNRIYKPMLVANGIVDADGNA